jgi:hypothetical protein
MSRPVATTTASEEPMAATAPENGSHNEPDRSRQPATEAARPVTDAPVPPQEPRHEPTTAHDTSRNVATEPTATGGTSRYVAHLERQLEAARDERDFLREQRNRKDKTIDALLERDKETNYLVRGLQEMLTPLLGGGRRRDDPPTYSQ